MAAPVIEHALDYSKHGVFNHGGNPWDHIYAVGIAVQGNQRVWGLWCIDRRGRTSEGLQLKDQWYKLVVRTAGFGDLSTHIWWVQPSPNHTPIKPCQSKAYNTVMLNLSKNQSCKRSLQYENTASDRWDGRRVRSIFLRLASGKCDPIILRPENHPKCFATVTGVFINSMNPREAPWPR